MKNAKKKSGNKKKQYHPMKKFFSVFLVMVGCSFTYMSAKEIITTMQLQQEIKQTEAEIEALKTQEAKLEEQKQKFSDEEYVKRYARGKFLLSKDGETLYKLNDQESDNTNDKANTDAEQDSLFLYDNNHSVSSVLITKFDKKVVNCSDFKYNKGMSNVH